MKKLLKKFKKNKKGFTLIELIIVIAILAILVGIVGFQATKYIKKSRVSADLSTMDSVESAAKTALADPDLGFDLTDDVTIKVAKNGTISGGEVKALDGTTTLNKAIEDNLEGKPALKSVASGRELQFKILATGQVTSLFKVNDTTGSIDDDGVTPTPSK